MAPSAVNEQDVVVNGVNGHATGENGFTRHGSYANVDTLNPQDHVHFDPSLKPKKYQIKGTDPGSKILFRDVNILDSTGRDPFRGDVYIEGTQSLCLGS